MSDFDTEKKIDEVIRLLKDKVKKSPETQTQPNMVGFKDTIMWREFKDMETKRGLFGFINGESCAACAEYLKQLKNLGSLKSKMTIVLLMKPHMEEVLQTDGVSVPFTRIYDGKDEPIWEVQGILYSTQLESLFRSWNKAETGEPIHTMDEFNVFSAKARPKEVKAFEAKSFLNIEIGGKNVIARQGQFVVWWPEDGGFEVLNPEEFGNRFGRV